MKSLYCIYHCTICTTMRKWMLFEGTPGTMQVFSNNWTQTHHFDPIYSCHWTLNAQVACAKHRSPLYIKNSVPGVTIQESLHLSKANTVLLEKLNSRGWDNLFIHNECIHVMLATHNSHTATAYLTYHLGKVDTIHACWCVTYIHTYTLYHYTMPL